MNINKVKLKKNILIILLMLAIMLILSGSISSLATKVNAYSFKSISGKTWNTTESIARLYNYLVSIDKDSGTLPTYNKLRDDRIWYWYKFWKDFRR